MRRNRRRQRAVGTYEKEQEEAGSVGTDEKEQEEAGAVRTAGRIMNWHE